MTDAGRLVLGTAQWGSAYGIANQDGPPRAGEIRRMAAAALSAGIRTADTARAYGSAEASVGAALDLRWSVVTKLDPDVAGEGVDAKMARRRASASLAASRSALRRERLDTVLLHRASHRVASQGAAWSVLREELAAGRIGAIGASVMSVEEAFPLLDDPSVEVIQVPASLFDRRLLRSGFFSEAERRGRQVFVRSVFLQGAGFLATAQLPDHLAPLRPLLRELDQRSSDAGCGRAALLMNWAKRRLDPAHIIIGCDSKQQLQTNLAAWGVDLPDEVIRACEDAVPDLLPDAILDPWRWPA